MNVFSYITTLIQRLAIYQEKLETLNQLTRLSDGQLEDMGISRLLLEQGTASYPWRVAEEQLAPHYPQANGATPKHQATPAAKGFGQQRLAA